MPTMTRAIADALDGARLANLLQELGREAARHRFEVAPNPCVGAAVLSGERVIARGFHEVWGQAHAEVNALDQALQSGVPASEWDVLVITLEPCSTSGKTPPCTERILASGIRHVVVGALDPDKRHEGAGLRILQDAGIEVHLLEDASPLTSVAPHFLSWNDSERLRRPRPWTIAKWAQTRTGQLTPPTGVGGGRWISGPESLREVQVLRGRVDAIVTGVGTVLADDPRFTVRAPGDTTKAPLRIVFDSYLRTPSDASLFRTPGPEEGAGKVHILCLGGVDTLRYRALIDAGAEIHELHASAEAGVSLRDAQAWMWELGIRRVLLEAGPKLLTRHLDRSLVDQLRVYTGSVNGGRGPSMVESLARLRFADRLDREWGGDSVLEAFLR